MRLLLLLCLCLPALAQVRVEQDGRDLRVLARQPVQARARVQGGTARLDVFPAGTLTGRLPAGVVASRPAEGRLRFEWPAPPHTAARLVRSSDLRAVRVSLGPAQVSRVRGVTADLVDRDLVEVVRLLSGQMGRRFYLPPGVEGSATVRLRNAPPEAALAIILGMQASDLDYLVMANGTGQTLVVAPPEMLQMVLRLEYPAGPSPTEPVGPRVRQEILLEKASATQVMEFLAGQYKNVQFTAHPTMNGFYVYGAPKDVLQIKSEVPNLDRPPAPAPTPAREFVAVKYADINEVKALLATLVPDVQYGVDTRQNTLILEGSPGAIEQVKELLAEFDRPTEQVVVDCKVVDILNARIQEVGLTDASLRTAVVKRPSMMVGTSLLQFLVSESAARVLAAPRVATQSGESAVIWLGDRLPLTSFDPVSGEFATTKLDLGLSLTVLPTVRGDKELDLALETQFSTITSLTSGQYPCVERLIGNYELKLNDGDTVVVRGLFPSEHIEAVSRIPLLADLSFLGTIVRPALTTPPGSEVVLMLTPHIMK